MKKFLLQTCSYPGLGIKLQMFFFRSTVVRALRVGLVVGVILNLINHFEALGRLQFEQIDFWSFGLAFIVPYLVSSFSTVFSQARFRPGDVSPVDAMLHCNNCQKVDFNVSAGDEIDQCPGCGDHTDWHVKQVESKPVSGADMIKSLALFARHNPQPLFRVDRQGGITGVNPAAHEFFDREKFVGIPIDEVFPEFPQPSEIPGIIKAGKTFTLTVNVAQRVFHLHVRGVPSINTLNIYCNEITRIVEAQQKIKEQARDINASIEYAKRIQSAMLPTAEMLENLLDECFVFFRPRDVVSGDFFWASQVNGKNVVAVADCTGHGVPGAVMSMLGMSLLNEIVVREKVLEPERILDLLRERLVRALSQGGARGKVEDGLDISLIVFEKDKRLLSFAGAYNPAYVFRGTELIELKADRMPIGNFMHEMQPFTEKNQTLEKGDRIYLFSDGYKDQFGGPHGKKFSARAFKKLLADLDGLSCPQQDEKVEQTFDSWKNDQYQVDDVTILGMVVK